MVTQSPGIALSTVVAQSNPETPVVPGFEIQQVTYALQHRSGSNAVANVGAFAWTNPANAQGLNTVTSTATMAGDVAAARNGVLQALYANFTGKSDLAISLVRLHFYVSSSGTVANNGNLRLYWRADGATTFAGATLLEAITGDVSSLSTPRTFVVTSTIGGDWAKLDNLVCFVQGITDVGENLINYAVNAIEVEVAAAVTDAL